MEIGVDLAEIDSISKIIENNKYKTFLFTEHERDSAFGLSTSKQLEYYASRFCVKEAVAKALGTGFIDKDKIKWCDIEIVGVKGSKPKVTLHNNAKKRLVEMGYKNVKISLSHKSNYVVAFVLLE